jgi:hypothetical protein
MGIKGLHMRLSRHHPNAFRHVILASGLHERECRTEGAGRSLVFDGEILPFYFVHDMDTR